MQAKRSSRVGDQIRREISEIILLVLKDPQLGFITITDVELTEDLRYAKVFYSVLGDEKRKRKAIKVWSGPRVSSRGKSESESGSDIRRRLCSDTIIPQKKLPGSNSF